MIGYKVTYKRHLIKKKVIVYAPNQAELVQAFPKNTHFIKIKKLNETADILIRKAQGVMVSERVMNQRIINLLELIENCLEKESLQLNKILQENILSKKGRYFQYELCKFYYYLRGGNSISDAIVDVLKVPNYVSGILKIAEKANAVIRVLKKVIAHFKYLVSRNFRMIKIIYINGFIVVTEVIAAHYAAVTKFDQYFFSIKFRGDQPPLIAKVYVDIFKNIDVYLLVEVVAAILVAVVAVKVSYRLLNKFKYAMDFLALYTPLARQIVYVGTQLNIYRSLHLAETVHMTYGGCIDIITIQIENKVLQERWLEIVANQERYAMNIMAMVDALFSSSATLIRPEPETLTINKIDIELLEMDVAQRYFRQDALIIGIGLIIVVAIPLWGIIAYAYTQNQYWLKALTLSIGGA